MHDWGGENITEGMRRGRTYCFRTSTNQWKKKALRAICGGKPSFLRRNALRVGALTLANTTQRGKGVRGIVVNRKGRGFQIAGGKARENQQKRRPSCPRES